MLNTYSRLKTDSKFLKEMSTVSPSCAHWQLIFATLARLSWNLLAASRPLMYFFFEHPEEREISLIYDLIMWCCILNVFGSVCPKDKLVVGLVGLSWLVCLQSSVGLSADCALNDNRGVWLWNLHFVTGPSGTDLRSYVSGCLSKIWSCFLNLMMIFFLSFGFVIYGWLLMNTWILAEGVWGGGT